MKYKILKLSWVSLLCFLFAALVAGSNSKLEIFRNVNGLFVEVPSKLKVPSGVNLTLTCKVENIKNKGLVNGYVTWFIPIKLHSEWKLRGLKNGSNLVFSNVNENNEGLYVCGSLKIKNFKIFHLLVEHNKSAKPNYINVSRLSKRDIVPGYGPHDYNISDIYIPDYSQLNAELDRMREDLLRQIKEDNENKIYTNNNDIIFDNINNNHHSNSHSSIIKPIAAVFGTLLIVFVVFLIIRFCGYMNQSSSTNRNNRQLNTQHNAAITAPLVNRCGHTSCVTNYLTNPSGACRYRNDNSPSAPIIIDPMDVEMPRAPHLGNLTSHLDLPPTYSSSAHNSTQNLNNGTTYGFNKEIVNPTDSNNFNLPPSYNEAVGHKDHNYNGVASHTPSGQHHSSSDGFSGNHSSEGGGGHSGSRGGGDSGGGHGGGGDSRGGGDCGGGGSND